MKKLKIINDKKALLETFPNEYQDRDYRIVHKAPEFTSLCPKTGQPDFAKVIIRYVPNELCIELKSLKLYLNAYRNEGMFYESVTNQILDDLVSVCEPNYMNVRAKFNTRGGISSVVEVEYDEFDEFDEFMDEDFEDDLDEESDENGKYN